MSNTESEEQQHRNRKNEAKIKQTQILWTRFA